MDRDHLRDLFQAERSSTDGLLRNAFAHLDDFLSQDPERTPSKVDAVYVPGLSATSVAAYSLFDHTANMIREKHPVRVYFNGSDGHGAGDCNPGSAWPGGPWVADELTTRGVPKTILTPTGVNGVHTRAETDELVTCCSRDAVKSLLIATVPYHRVRSLSCLLGSMTKVAYFFDAFYADFATIDPQMVIVGSQGRKVHTLPEEIEDEIERTIRYWCAGGNDRWMKEFGAPPDVIVRYLRNRTQSVDQSN